MRTKALICAATLIAAGVATSMAQNVYSLNVVGYVQKVVPTAGKLIAVANPLTTTNNTIGGLFPTATYPLNYAIFKWNYAGAKFDIYTRVGFGNGWNPSTSPTVTLNPGEGFFLKSPSTAATPFTNTFVGEVLQSYSANTPASISNYLASALWLTGNMVPDSNTVSQLNLIIPFSSTFQNQVLKWNLAGQKYDIFTRVGFGSGWNPSEPAVDAGEGFFTKLQTAQSWLRNFTVQ